MTRLYDTIIDIKKNQNIHSLIIHQSSSGMKRVVRIFVIHRDMIVDISGIIAKSIGYTFDRNHGGINVSGTGFDAGDEIVRGLSYSLFGNTDDLTHIRL